MRIEEGRKKERESEEEGRREGRMEGRERGKIGEGRKEGGGWKRSMSFFAIQTHTGADTETHF